MPSLSMGLDFAWALQYFHSDWTVMKGWSNLLKVVNKFEELVKYIESC